MAPLVSTIEIARPPEEVFGYATDPRHFAEWQHDVVRVELLGGGRFATTRRINGAERTMTQRITRSEPPRTWVAEGVDGPIRPYARVTVEPLDGGAASRATFALDFTGHGIGVPLAPVVRRLAARGAPDSYRNLKHLLEATSGTPRG